MSKLTVEQIKAVVLGHAVADALGVPVEFCNREVLDRAPVTEMRGYGSHPVPLGTWSDDTSMAIAALDALATWGIDHAAVADAFYQWYRKAKYTATGEVFDVGGTCARVISNYEAIAYAKGDTPCLPIGFDATRLGEGTVDANGNGSLMRIYPFVLYAAGQGMSDGARDALIDDASALTHAHPRSKLACRIYALLLSDLLARPQKKTAHAALLRAKAAFGKEAEAPTYHRLWSGDLANIPRNGIKSSGYVVDTLEAAVWCLLTTDSYAACVLQAVNLGQDTDTVAAVAGALAGALYGLGAIPTPWLDTLQRRPYLESLSDALAARLGL